MSTDTLTARSGDTACADKATDADERVVERLADYAVASLLGEARLTPKPGLVDRRNTGAHTDMDLALFETSAQALRESFAAYAQVGMRLHDATPSELAEELRRLGVAGERAMFAATGGVNTHKGANFAFALILGACGSLMARGAGLPFSARDTERVRSLVSSMGVYLLTCDTERLSHRVCAEAAARGVAPAGAAIPAAASDATLTHGEKIMLASGMTGARGEAARGYPLVAETFMPFMRAWSAQAGAQGVSSKEAVETALLRCLVLLMARLEDTNVVHRGGAAALPVHQARCAQLECAELDGEALKAALIAYDDELIARNISPGGAADLLSLGVFFAQLEGLLIAESPA